jgi:methyl-accepting chemotaxis protein
MEREPGTERIAVSSKKLLGILPQRISQSGSLENTVYYLSLSELTVGLLLGVIGGIMFTVSPNIITTALTLLGIYCLIVFGISTYLLLKRKSTSARWLVFIGTAIVMLIFSFIYPVENLTVVLVLWLPPIGALLFGWRGLVVSGIISTLSTAATVLVLNVWKLYQPISTPVEFLGFTQIVSLTGSIILITVIVFLLMQNLNNALRKSEIERQKVLETNKMLDEQRAKVEELSRRLSEISQRLALTSRQQASGATQQVSAVAEVTTSLEELSQTSQQIYNNAELVTIAAVKTMQIVGQVEKTTSQAVDRSDTGQEATRRALVAIRGVQQNYEALSERLQELNQRSQQINQAISLISNISNQTHLLSLNAAIESAGAGELGSRFAIVAQEVKQLAERTRNSAREIKEVVGEVTLEIGSATDLAVNGLNEADLAVQRATEVGEIILELAQVVQDSARDARHFEAVAEHNQKLAEEIQLATGQQHSASQQIVETMHGIGTVASETALSAKNVAGNTAELEQLSDVLRFTLLERKNGRSVQS